MKLIRPTATACSMPTLSPPHVVLLFLLPLPTTLALDFHHDYFDPTSNSTDILLVQDAGVDAARIRLTNDSIQYSLGRVFHSKRLSMMPNRSDPARLASFSTSFVFSLLPRVAASPRFGLCFVLSNTTSPPGALASQYFGLFTNATVSSVAPLIAVEFDIGQNPEFNDPDGNHIGVDLNRIESAETSPAGYYNSSDDASFVPVEMWNGRNVHAWIDFDGANLVINVSVAPVGVAKPVRPTLSYRDPVIANYVAAEMFVGFSASTTTWIEAQRILAWSLSDTGQPREINTTGLPIFLPESSSSSLSPGAIAGIVLGCVVFLLVVAAAGVYLFWRKLKSEQEEDEIEDWELEYWPHRFAYEELDAATNSFSEERLLGAGGFGRVYKGVLSNDSEVAVKCVKHDSKQGLREFMAEISSMGRLQHKNLVQMRGWCRRGNELILVYDFMPNGSLDRWIFGTPRTLMGWSQRRRVINDVAEGLSYLHHGWDQVVIHRDIKSSNVLLDSEMQGRLGDFGLAKLYQHGEAPNTTRVVGTLGYLAPELASSASPTEASDVYSFGVVVLEIVCGRRPIEFAPNEEDSDLVLVDWVREMYVRGRLSEAADRRISGECEEREIEAVMELGLACCHPNPVKRPKMKDVVALLIGDGATTSLPGELLSELVPSGGGGSNRSGQSV